MDLVEFTYEQSELILWITKENLEIQSINKFDNVAWISGNGILSTLCHKSVFREFLTDPEEFINKQVNLNLS